MDGFLIWTVSLLLKGYSLEVDEIINFLVISGNFAVF